MQRFINSIEFDLTSSCNSVCPNCARFKEHDGQLYRNPLVKFDQHLPVEKVKEILNHPCVTQTVDCTFVGLMGDALAHPHFLEIIDIVITKAKRGHICIHSNGGLRNVKYWEQLGKKLADFHHVCFFSIDGLEDTNHLYRRGVKWDKVIDNAKSFINAGGNAVWKFIKFPWNEHQIKKAKIRAKTLGFTDFEVRPDRDPVGASLHLQKIANNGVKKSPAPTQQTQPLYRPDKISILKQNLECSPNHININYAGQVNPCCWFNSIKTEDRWSDHYAIYADKENTQWNNINFNDFASIVNNTWWKDLYASVRSAPIQPCIFNCGLDKEKSVKLHQRKKPN